MNLQLILDLAEGSLPDGIMIMSIVSAEGSLMAGVKVTLTTFNQNKNVRIPVW